MAKKTRGISPKISLSPSAAAFVEKFAASAEAPKAKVVVAAKVSSRDATLEERALFQSEQGRKFIALGGKLQSLQLRTSFVDSRGMGLEAWLVDRLDWEWDKSDADLAEEFEETFEKKNCVSWRAIRAKYCRGAFPIQARRFAWTLKAEAEAEAKPAPKAEPKAKPAPKAKAKPESLAAKPAPKAGSIASLAAKAMKLPPEKWSA